MPSDTNTPTTTDEGSGADDDPGPEVLHRTRHDWTGGGTLVETVCGAVAAVDPDYDPTDSVPVYRAVGIEHVERLFTPLDFRDTPTQGSVSFRYAGYSITVAADGGVTVRGTDPTAADAG